MKWILALLLFNSVYASELLETITDRREIFTFLFQEIHELHNKDCHRRVIEARSPRTMIAMGCSLQSLEIYQLSPEYNSILFKGLYQCPEGEYPFSAFCRLK